MKRILLVDLGERELQKRRELRARQQSLKTIEKTAETSGGLSARQHEELEQITAQLGSDVVIDPFYRLVAATHQQRDWSELEDNREFIHVYGLLGSQRGVENLLDSLDPNEREIAAICGLLQIEGYTDAARPDFVQRISIAQGEYRKNRKLFDAAYAQLEQRYAVALQSQIDAGLIDKAIVGCIDPDADPEARAARLDRAVARREALAAAQAAEKVAKDAELSASAAKEAKKAATKDVAARMKAVETAAESGDAAKKEAKAALAVAKTAETVAVSNAATTTTAANNARMLATAAWSEAKDEAINDDIQAAAAGYLPKPDDIVSALSGRNVAALVRQLAKDGVSANDAWLASRIQNAYDMQTGVVTGAPPSAMEIMLPDLEESTDVAIIRENLHAVQAIYFAYMLEQMRLPQVIEKIVDLFRAGLLPLGRGKAGDYLFNYFKKASERITEGERRDLYLRVFGAPGGDPGNNQPNSEFNELWLRFVSAVSSFGRQLTVDRLLRSNVPVAVSQEQVRKSGRDLGANLSLHGYGIAYFAATDLQQMILEARDNLSDREILTAFGARDMWQVIDQVNAGYLGGARNTHRYRTQARAGAVIIRWLANHHERLSGRFGEVISLDALTNRQLRGSDQPTVEPNDWDLVQACEQWLAVGGVQDNSVEQYAQPVESPVITSKPIQMPEFAREAIESMTGGLNGSGLNGSMPLM